MHSLTSLATLIALPLLALTAPTPQGITNDQITTQQYRLKTAYATECPDRFNDLYLAPGDIIPHSNIAIVAILTPDKGNAAIGFQNTTLQAQDQAMGGSYQQFNLTGDFNPWGLSVTDSSEESEYDYVTFSLGYGSAGFVLHDGFLYRPTIGLSAWLACDWSLSSPQLLALAPNSNGTIPDNCTTVQLMPEFV